MVPFPYINIFGGIILKVNKILKVLFIGALSAMLLAACGGKVDDIKQTEGEKAKVKTSETASTPAKEEEKKEEKKEDIWTYYENANWEDNFNGLKSTIQKVVVSDQAPGYGDDGKEIITSAVGLKFQIENTTDGKFTTYPDQATLVTSTGEQVEADMLVSDHLGGEIDKGVIKEGNVIFYLKRGNADKIEWVKLSWDTRQGAEDNFDAEIKTYEVELQLK